MKRKYIIRKFTRTLAIAILTGALLLSGCGAVQNAGGEGAAQGVGAGNTQTAQESTSASGVQKSQTAESQGKAQSVQTSGFTVSDMFSDRDSKTEYDEAECTVIILSGDSATCESKAVSVEAGVVIIKEAGNYILRGSFNGSIRVDAPEDAKVWLILDGVSVTAEGTAAVYAKEADKVFVTTSKGSKNVITNTGEFKAIDDNNIDGAIYSKCDMTLNGNGTLVVSSEKGHGIVSKDDLKITSGTYEITTGDHGISGKDSIRILDGNMNITSTEDGLHSGNDEDADKGYVYIVDGDITINAGDDGIHGESRVVIEDGKIDIAKCTEGIEAAIVEIDGGDVNVVASDDGINATDGSGTEGFGGFGGFGGRGGFGQQGSKDGANGASGQTTPGVYILIAGGKVTVDAKGDGVDSNGGLYVTGGEVYVNGPENGANGALDYDSTGEITGGTLIAIGSSGMAMNFSSSTQGSALVTFSGSHAAGETVQLKDSKGNVIVSLVSARKFATVVVSSPLMKQGETYTLTAGSESKEFTLDQLIYGNGFGGFGGGFGGGMRGQMPGGFGGGQGGQMPEGFDGNFNGQMPEGFDGNFNGQLPEGFEGFNGQMPEGFDGNFNGQLPEGFDGNFNGQLPEGFDGNFNGQMPEGFNGQRPSDKDGQGGQQSDGKGGKSGKKSEGSTGDRQKPSKSNDDTTNQS
ncbi:MAG: carbohydrate-binding domain-containing protein [Lachnospiraceae bacterium]|nr:carbohydrate-binding domain-containing protein [Lachnospiraceae bacterium]